ncbi:hypothetical protein UFOVP669_22 [uncultured Caudovirales phage]|uniref:Uncharacterized protein n=1 Tax=uncultured Caudovirales phage TaxID=2100421 RepID=A0A6J5M0H3_9CAUD|nr:hypothetical protein UFOVP400_13 [uncultured Caudovirales phage]CAB4155685.1 hypothetical protein UFOVP669_22 [uncultured Caudovirales phage]CAB4213556.1 hypothetical protein UFOVP1449_49 [uncultured Caudovirales phage]
MKDERAELIENLKDVVRECFTHMVNPYGSPPFKTYVTLEGELILKAAALLAADAREGGEVVAWGVFAKIDDGSWHLQHPVRFTKEDADADHQMYEKGAQLLTRPLYTHPQPQAVPHGWKLVPVEALIRWRDAFAEEISAYDIDPPIHHVKASHDEIDAMLAAAQAAPQENKP